MCVFVCVCVVCVLCVCVCVCVWLCVCRRDRWVYEEADLGRMVCVYVGIYIYIYGKCIFGR